MLTKISGLARTLYILLAIIAAFVSLGTLNVTLVLFVLGLVAGLPLVAKEDLIWRAVSVLVLPIIATVLATIQAIGEQLSALAGNLQIGLAGAVATAIARQLYMLAVDGVTGLVASNKK
ncbi:MAG: hypothetical protein RI895_651 [Actinomycetota bacterium]|jgi:hypothetical protein